MTPTKTRQKKPVEAKGGRTADERCPGCRRAPHVAGCAGPTEREVAAAYAVDRSEQYSDNSSAKVALQDLAWDLRHGEHVEAFRVGELDDLISWARESVRYESCAQVGCERPMPHEHEIGGPAEARGAK